MPILAFPFSSIIDVPSARILARDDAGTGPAEALTNTEIFAILGTGTPDATTYLRGDGTWSTVTAGVGGSTGSVDNAVLRADGTGGSTLQTSGWIVPDIYTASPNATVNHLSMQATGASTNVSVSIVPKGSGAFSLQTPDGTATGGNVRGANAVDMQTARQSASQVASGQYSAVFGFGSTASDRCGFAAGYLVSVTGPDAAGFGQFITVSGPAAFAINLGCEAVSNYSFASGLNARTYLDTMRAHAGGSFSNKGDSQYSRFVLRNKTTTDSAVALRMWDISGNNSRRLVVPAGKILLCSAMVIGSKSDGSVVATYFRQFSVKRVGNTTSLVGTVNTIGTDEAAGTSLSITADDTSESIEIAPTGVLNETWRWAAVVEAIEIEFGT